MELENILGRQGLVILAQLSHCGAMVNHPFLLKPSPLFSSKNKNYRLKSISCYFSPFQVLA
jgi:hypothetical protein